MKQRAAPQNAGQLVFCIDCCFAEVIRQLSGEKVNEALQMFESICRGDYQSPGGTNYEFAAAFGEYETFYRAGGS